MGADAPRNIDVRLGVDVLEDVHQPRPIVIDVTAISGTVSADSAEQIAEGLERFIYKLRAAVATVRGMRTS